MSLARAQDKSEFELVSQFRELLLVGGYGPEGISLIFQSGLCVLHHWSGFRGIRYTSVCNPLVNSNLIGILSILIVARLNLRRPTRLVRWLSIQS